MLYSSVALAAPVVDNSIAHNPEKVKPVQDDNIIKDIIESIPSPVEISMAIKDSKGLYNKNLLSPTDNASNYSDSYKKALNLGVYGTDLGFANIYGRTTDVLSYLNVVRDLANDLGIGQFFDYNTIKKLAESADNLDLLIAETTSNFDKINYNLRQQRRDNLSILMLTGGWLEATYLTTKVYEQKNDPVLREKIGEQKVVLEQILLVLDLYKTNPGFGDLLADLRELERAYESVEIVTTMGGGVTQEIIDGQLVVSDGSESSVEITDADIQNISSLIKSIRNKIIS
jgi:hypothetical protein